MELVVGDEVESPGELGNPGGVGGGHASTANRTEPERMKITQPTG